MGLKGKRFVFAIVAMICASVVTIILKYPADIYLKIVLALSAVFTVGQTYSDIKNSEVKK
ncbi:MAG: hypothetical protein KKH94_06535 [Candidatus Omnitrophica bacterium]|nr:hypothetical protein [Candidatus Omnitrophota bacterium]